MKLARLVTTVVALSIGFGNVAFAQGGPRGEGSRAEQRGHPQHRAAERRQDRREDRREDRRADRHADRHADRMVDRHGQGFIRHDPRSSQHWARGAGPRHDLYRGGHLPHNYRSRVHVVNNWHASHLRRPPVGYHWVRVGGDHVLAAITTGVILSILLGH